MTGFVLNKSRAVLLFLAASCSLSLLIFPPTAWAQTCNTPLNWRQASLSEDDFLIVALRVNRQTISTGIDSYVSQDRLFLPVSALNTLLKMNWEVDIDNRHIRSINDGNPLVFQFPCEFDIELNSSEPSQDETRATFDWIADDFDLYIDARALNILLQATHVLDYSSATVTIETKLALPGVKGAFDDLIPRFSSPEIIAPNRIIPDSYSAFSFPQTNYRVNGVYDNESGELNGQVQINSFFDLLHHDVELRINQSNDSGSQFIRFGKSFPVANQTEPDNVLRYEFGDILLQSDELIVNAKQAAGIQLFNTNPNSRRNFSTITIEEITLPGWRAQLFRNGQFIDEVFTNDDNRVVFDEVETFFGLNQFEIKLYGPEGQQEVRTQSVNVGTRLKPKAFDFAVSFADTSTNVIDSNEEEAAFDQQFIARVGYGINSSTSLELSTYSLSGLGEEQHYLSSSVNTGLGRTTLRAQVAKELDEGEAYFLGINSDLGRQVKLNLQGAFLNDFTSEQFTESRDLTSELSATLNGTSHLGSRINWNARFSHRNFENRRDQNQLNLRANTRLFKGIFSTTFAIQNLSQPNRVEQRINWSRNFSGWNLSTDLSWNPFRNQRVSRLNTTLRWPGRLNVFNESRISFNNNDQGPLRFEHLINWRRKEFNLRFGSFVTEDGEWGLNFGITGDIEYDPFNQTPHFYRSRGNHVSTIQAFAFLDENRNSLYDEFESPLSDVQLLGNVQWRDSATNNDGYVQVSTRQREQDIKVDEASLPDIFMRPAEDKVRVITHPGGRTKVNLPVVTFNEIEGAVYINKGKKSRGFAGLNVSIVDQLGTVIASTQTELDGFFFLTNIEPGEYHIQLDTGQLAAQDLTIINALEIIDAPLEGDIIRVNDIVLTTKEEALKLAQRTVENNQNASPLPQNEQLQAVQAETHTSLPSVSATPKPIERNSDYYVQLGVFKQPSSIVHVLQYLPSDQFDLTMYRDHKKALSYVVIGPYKTKHQALEASTRIRQYRSFKGAFVRPAHRFIQDHWSVEYELMDLYQHLERSHQQIQDASGSSIYCQLASYRALTSIPPHHLNSLASLLIVKREVNTERYYTILTGPYSMPSDCQSQVDPRWSQGKAFPVSSVSIKNSLLRIN